MTIHDVLRNMRDNQTCKFSSVSLSMEMQDLVSLKYWMLDYPDEQSRITFGKSIVQTTDWQLVYFEDDRHVYQRNFEEGIWTTRRRGQHYDR